MDDDRIEQLLKGYRLPDVSRDLDDRVLREGIAIMEHARVRAAAEDLGRTVLDRLGLGFVAWIVDVVTTADAEYRVEFL